MNLIQLTANNVIVLHAGSAHVFSYDSEVLVIKLGNEVADHVTKVGSNWNYSKTTLGHVNKSLQYLGMHELAKMSGAKKEQYFKSCGLI